MWIKINGEPLHTSSIKNISKIEKITTDNIINFFNRRNNDYDWFSEEFINQKVKMDLVYSYVISNNKSTGNVVNYLKNEDGTDNINHIIKSNFSMDSDKFLFTIYIEYVSYSGENNKIDIKHINSKIFDTIEEATEVHNNLISKLNEIEMSLINIEI